MIRKILRILKIKESLQRYNIYDTVFKFLEVNKIEGCYAEFGTYQGRSAKFALESLSYYNRLKIFKSYYFFDSFEGLPDLTFEDSKNNNNQFRFQQYKSTVNDFKKNIKKYLNDIDYNIVEGYYHDTLLDSEISENFSFIHIDVDLYSSCKDVLNFLKGRLSDGSILLFDDYFCYRGRRDSGVQHAFNEWLEDSCSNYIAREYYKYSVNGCSFILNIK